MWFACNCKHTKGSSLMQSLEAQRPCTKWTPATTFSGNAMKYLILLQGVPECPNCPSVLHIKQSCHTLRVGQRLQASNILELLFAYRPQTNDTKKKPMLKSIHVCAVCRPFRSARLRRAPHVPTQSNLLHVCRPGAGRQVEEAENMRLWSVSRARSP